MEDQTASLKARGLNAERIHSGRMRIQSRQVARSYLDGALDFLFIAPERLAVPGFPEMLAKRKPVLIAIDEAHCISQWGHDFRPDYRLLGERLPVLMPTPVIAITATATPRVQDDIINQIGINDAEMHIHGFRRDNIAIELLELLPSERTRKVMEILAKRESRPTIIYAPTRQKTEDLAEELKDILSVEPYHAGMPPEERDRVQRKFLSGEIDAIVATIAFGMGIDKPDIRTVIHTAMPGSLEGYYQEIGRAGRDGKQSNAILLHSYGDRQVHLFFHEKSYPPENVLTQIQNRLTKNKIPVEKLRVALDMEEEEFDTALEKLWIHGGVQLDSGNSARLGHKRWHTTYKKQRDHRLSQIDEMARFAGSFSCRMLYLVKHFGDREDKGNQCGLCDYCAPEKGQASNTREPNRQEIEILKKVISLLKDAHGLSAGKLFSSACPGSAFHRSGFENLLRSLVRNDLIILSEQSFEKDSRTIHYKRAELTKKGYSIKDRDINNIPIITTGHVTGKQSRKEYEKKRPDLPKKARRSVSEISENQIIYSRLRTWRNTLARKRGIPAFRIFSNKVLANLVSDLPTANNELLMVSGVGPYFVEKYGKTVIEMIKDYLKENPDE